jgi:AcrR family transcriptional regulator
MVDLSESSPNGRAERLSRLVTAAPARGGTSPENVARLVAAARACFARQGVQKTRMGHVAEEAGMARQTTYDFVTGLDELVELAVLQRAREIAGLVTERIGRGPRKAADAMVEHLATLTELTRDDTEFAHIGDALSRGQALSWIGTSGRMQAILLDNLRPRFDQARRQGVLREDVPEPEMTAWIQTSLSSLLGRVDLSPQELRHTIRTFLLPALLRDAD